MTELIQEIYGTIMRNKLRTLLTGFSVAWGIFMLIVLLGAGNGLIHAFENQSKGMIMNSMKIYPGMTSQPYKGMKEGRSIYLKESDRKLTATSFPDHIIQTGATVSKSDVILTYGKEALSIGINGVFPNYPSLEAIKIKEGRFVNARDMEERRKIIVLHEKTVKEPFSSHFSHREIPERTRCTLSGGRYLYRPEQFFAFCSRTIHYPTNHLSEG